jgi:hypothetical protein
VYRYSILIHTGRGGSRGRVEPERRGEGQQFTKLGRKYQHDLQTINSAKHSAVYKFCKTPAAKSLYRSIFLDDDILHCLLGYGIRDRFFPDP